MSFEYVYPEEKYILIGTVTKAHGMRGEVKILCFSGEPEQVSDYENVVLVDRRAALSPVLAIKKTRPQGKIAITLLESISDRNLSESIEGAGVLIHRADLPEIDEDEYYWHQLIGKSVVDTKGNLLGKIDSIFSNGAQDIMVLGKRQGHDVMIPIVAEIVLDTDGEQVVIDPPAGLLDMNEREA